MLVVGAGGLAMQMLDDLEDQFGNNIVFWINVHHYKNILKRNYKFISSETEISDYFKKDNRFILAVSGPNNRQQLANLFSAHGGVLTSFISQKANISRHATINTGCTILQNAVVEAEASLGNGCLINVGAVITHECLLHNFTEVAPLALIAGNVRIGEKTFVGSNATVLPKLHIGSEVTIGAGAVVTKDIPDGTKVAGIPAKPFKV